MRYWLALGFGWAAWAGTEAPTGIDLSKLAHPALTKMRSGALRLGERALFDGITATASAMETTLRGKGKSGRAWTVHLCDICFDEVWRADLDGNDTADYIIFGRGPGGNGRTAPSFSLSFLLMDKEGMPVPFFTTVYQGENGEGIKHLVLLDGHIRLLIRRYDEIPSNPRVGLFCSGHWVTQQYRFTQTTVEEVRGIAGGMRFPFVYNWSYSDPECAHSAFGISQPAKVQETGTSVQGAVRSTSRSAGECPEWSADTVVFDTKGEREVAFPNLRSDDEKGIAEAMVERMRAAGVEVELRGVHGCEAALMWGGR